MRGEGPLRYPGAKSNLAPTVAELVERHRLVGLQLAEPFAGSAAVSRYLLRKNLIESAILWEFDPGVFAFWKAVLFETEELQRRIQLADVSLREFDRCREHLFEVRGRPKDALETGYSFLFLNRTSYSGIVGAGPIGGRSQSSDYSIGCRFNKARLVRQIGSLGELRERVSIRYGDGIKAIAGAKRGTFLYVDPPYFSNGKKFYRKYFSDFDHRRLNRALRLTRAFWLLSYDYEDEIERLYRKLPTRQVDLYHSARGAGAKTEILVSPLGFGRGSLVASVG